MLEATRTFHDFAEAKAAADADGLTLCGTYEADGTPCYFLVPKGSTDQGIQALAFEIREGRTMSRLERQLADIAHRKDPHVADT